MKLKVLIALAVSVLGCPATAMDIPPGGVKIENISGIFRSQCRFCRIEPSGDELSCEQCISAYPSSRSRQYLWLKPCVNGQIIADIRTGRLICSPELAGNYLKHCKYTHIQNSHLLAWCRNNGESGSGIWTIYPDGRVDLKRCKRLVANWNRYSGLYCVKY